MTKEGIKEILSIREEMNDGGKRKYSRKEIEVFRDLCVITFSGEDSRIFYGDVELQKELGTCRNKKHQ